MKRIRTHVIWHWAKNPNGIRIFLPPLNLDTLVAINLLKDNPNKMCGVASFHSLLSFIGDFQDVSSFNHYLSGSIETLIRTKKTFDYQAPVVK